MPSPPSLAFAHAAPVAPAAVAPFVRAPPCKHALAPPRAAPSRRDSQPCHMRIKPNDPAPRPSSSSSSSPMSNVPPMRPNHSLANLHELTERIADLLQVGSIHKNTLHCPKDAPLGYLSATTHVAVVFGKHLIRDQLTVEYAKRILTLIKQIAAGSLNPDIICFAGGRGLSGSNTISEAAAGYSFFRSTCEEVNLDVSRFDIILEQQSRNSKENLRNVIEELRRRSGPDALSSCHFTLLSSDYHLIRIQEVHRLSPRQSVLFPLEVSSATWNCIFAAYPFCVSQDPPTAFLGRAVVLANDLGIVLVNLKGAIEDREFVSKENLHRLNETFAKMREMYRVIDSRSPASGGFRTDMRSHAETLELAIHNVREVHTLLTPLQEIGSSVPRPDLELAFELLSTTIRDMRSSMDPDRVLRLNDRVSIVDDMMNFMQEQAAAKAAAARSSPLAYGRALPSVPQPGLSDRGVDSPVPSWQHRGPSSSSTEVIWKETEEFKGNGKKIAIDGPNVVITDSSAPPVMSRSKRSPASRSASSPSSPSPAHAAPAAGAPAPPPAPAKRTRTRRRTAVDSDSLAGAMPGSLPGGQVGKPATRSATGTGTRGRSSSTTRKSRQTGSASTTSSTSTPKKRNSTSRKLSAPSGDAA